MSWCWQNEKSGSEDEVAKARNARRAKLIRQVYVCRFNRIYSRLKLNKMSVNFTCRWRFLLLRHVRPSTHWFRDYANLDRPPQQVLVCSTGKTTSRASPWQLAMLLDWSTRNWFSNQRQAVFSRSLTLWSKLAPCVILLLHVTQQPH